MKFLASLFAISIVQCLAEQTPNSENTIVQWPFMRRSKELYLQIEVGTPPQKLNISLHNFHTNRNLQILSKEVNGLFSRNESSSYFKADRVYDEQNQPLGLRSYENFNIGNRSFTSLPFVLQETSDIFDAQLGFGHRKEVASFWNQLLSQLPTQTVSIAFARFPHSGFVTLGGLDKKLCYDDWKFANLTYYTNSKGEERFGFENPVFELSRTSALFEGKLTISMNDDPPQWPKKVYKKLADALGSENGRVIQCGFGDSISIKVTRELKIEILNTEWIDFNSPHLCQILGAPVDDTDEMILPKSWIFKNNCVSIDHSKGQIGFATRRYKEWNCGGCVYNYDIYRD